MKIEKSVQITLIIAITLLVIFGISAFFMYSFMPTNTSDTLAVTGSSTIKVTPDLVTIYFNVETNGSTAQIAKDENAKIVDDVISTLLKNGFVRDDLQTLNFNMYPWQEWQNNKLVDKGYKVSHQIKIELKENNFESIGMVIDAGANAGALISTINFELSNDKQNQYKALALKQAGEEARIKADAIAEGVGKKIGNIVSISANEFNYYPWNVYTSSAMGASDVAMAKEATTNIAPSTQEVSGSLSVIYKII